jgi:drug/metabolite transporter (DMT)-like permease
MFIGVIYALIAGLMWGLVFVSPLLLPEYPPALQSVGRYLAFGLIALPLAWLDRRRLSQLSRADWTEALKLAAVGNLLYYLCLASAIQRAGGPLPTMIIGTLPVVIAITANRRNVVRDGKLPWRKLAPSLALIAAGIGCVNQVEIEAFAHTANPDVVRYASGALFAVAALVCWTWYPLRNADWLRHHPGRSPRTWATAQGIATLPLALLGYAALQSVRHALRAAPGVFRWPDGRHRSSRLVARHAVLERIEPAPADSAGRATDRLRNAGRACLCLHFARRLARAGDAARHRPPDCRRHSGRTHPAASRCRRKPGRLSVRAACIGAPPARASYNRQLPQFQDKAR